MRRRERSGSVVVLVAVLMVVLLGFGAFAVDVAQMQAYKSELRRTADAAALAAAKELLTDPGNARAMAVAYVGQNTVMGSTPAVLDTAYGTYDPVLGTFTPALPAVANAFRVTVRSDGEFYLAQLLGGSDFSAMATATAWLPVTGTPCAAPWALLEADFFAQAPSGYSDDSLRALPLNLIPGPNSAAYVLKQRDPAPGGTIGQWFGAVNLPAYPGNLVGGAAGYAQNILAGVIGAPCHVIGLGNLLQAKLTGYDDETIDAFPGAGVAGLCPSLRGNICYNHAGQIGVAVRVPLVRPLTGTLPCITDVSELDPLDILSSGLAMCHEVVGVRTFVIASAVQSGPERGTVIGLFAGDDSQGPVLGYAQRPVLVQ